MPDIQPQLDYFQSRVQGQYHHFSVLFVCLPFYSKLHCAGCKFLPKKPQYVERNLMLNTEELEVLLPLVLQVKGHL